MAYLNVVKVDEALRQMKEKFHTFDAHERVALRAAIGRILADDLYAKENLPAFRRSMVDGYAVKSSDTFGASEQSPILLGYLGQVEMGKRSDQTIRDGMALYVPTGGEIPTGADAMIMIEHTERLGPDVAVFSTPRQGEHIVEIGEDVSANACVLPKGTYLAPHHMGLLASLGISEVSVIRKPRVAILSTGDELVAVDETPSYGQVRDCNRPIIESVAFACGCEVTLTAHITDDFEVLKNALAHAVSLADLVILSGGSSAGTKDMTQSVIESLPGQSNVFIHGLAIKPGKPTIIGSVDHKPVIGLPGHPAACFITLKALVEPFIGDWIGQSHQAIKSVPCVSDFQLYAASGRDVYQLVRLSEANGNGVITAQIVYGKSGMVSALAHANAYVIVPMQHEGVMKGDALIAYLL
jgi:molybdopterin molybdotransferase